MLNTNRFLPKKGLLNPFNVTNAGTKTPLSDFKNHVRSVRGGGGVDCSQCTEQGARVIGLWRHMRAIHSLGTLPPESSNYQAAAGRSVLGIHIQPVEVNSLRTDSLGRSTHLALSPFYNRPLSALIHLNHSNIGPQSDKGTYLG